MIQGAPTGGGGPSPLQLRYRAVENRVSEDTSTIVGGDSPISLGADGDESSDGEEQSILADAMGLQTKVRGG